MLDLEETIDQQGKSNSVSWHRHVFRKDKESHLRTSFNLSVKGKMKTGRAKNTWLIEVVEQGGRVGPNEFDAKHQSGRRFGFNIISGKVRGLRHLRYHRQTRIIN